MGSHASGPWVHGLAVIGYLAIVGIVIAYLRQIIAAL